MFYPCPKSLSEAEFKSNGLICLAEEVPKQLSIQAVAWFLFTLFRQVYSGREQKVKWRGPCRCHGKQRNDQHRGENENSGQPDLGCIKFLESLMAGSLLPAHLNTTTIEFGKEVSRQQSFQFQVHKRCEYIETPLSSTGDNEGGFYSLKA